MAESFCSLRQAKEERRMAAATATFAPRCSQLRTDFDTKSNESSMGKLLKIVDIGTNY